MNSFAAARACAETLTESVLMYVISPRSYRSCASFMVFPGEKPSTLDAACWRVDVVNGGSVCLVFGCDATPETSSSAPARSSRMLFAVSRLRMSGLPPSKRESLATNVLSSEALRASTPIRKYVSGLNASISRCRSTSSLSATDWTRPADSERLLGQLMFLQSSGDTL